MLTKSVTDFNGIAAPSFYCLMLMVSLGSNMKLRGSCGRGEGFLEIWNHSATGRNLKFYFMKTTEEAFWWASIFLPMSGNSIINIQLQALFTELKALFNLLQTASYSCIYPCMPCRTNYYISLYPWKSK